MVLWLEEQKIRRYPVEQRKGLRDRGQHWQQHYEKYLKDLNCPRQDDNVQSLCWLLGYALMLEQMHGSSPTTTASFLDNVDVESQEFKDGLAKLATLLNIPPHPDPLVRLEACSKLLQSRTSMDDNDSLGGGVEISLKDHDFGFNDKTMDPVVKEAGKILRLLHLTNLRTLQSEINNTIELVQSVTANPKTDTKVGKVGR